MVFPSPNGPILPALQKAAPITLERNLVMTAPIALALTHPT